MDHKGLDQFSSYGIVGNEKIVCQYVGGHKNKGILLGDNPLCHATSVLISQIILMFFVGRITYSLLRPCNQTLLIAQIVAGIILGPSGLGRYASCFEMIFPTSSTMTLSTFAEFGMIIHFFKLGVQVNPKLLWKIEKPAMIIGFIGHMSSIALGSVVLHLVDTWSPVGSDDLALKGVVITGGLTAFPVISSFLNEMNILNSEVGRLALSTSIVSDSVMWILHFVVINSARALEDGSYRPVLDTLVSVCFFSILFFLLRPLVLWISNRNPQGKPMTEGNFLSIICILLLIGFTAQCTGQPGFLAAFLFGLVLPDGPPLGSVLAERLDTVGSTLIVPAYCTMSGLRTSAPSLETPKLASIEFVILAGYLGKFVGTFIPSLHYQIHFWDSFILSLIMCCKGLVDLCMYNFLFNAEVIGQMPFTLVIYTMVAVTGFATLIVSYIYDPSRRYRAYSRRSIRDSNQDHDLKLLVCVHDEDNVYPIINLLQATNPTKSSPLSVVVLHLMELQGRAASILTKNENTNKFSKMTSSSSQHISNVFDKFQIHNKGCVTMQFFASIAPYTSMHDDICYMAMDTKSNMVIVPFHKQWTINQTAEVSNASFRTLNINVLMKAPCSVGILIDRSHMNGNLLVIHEKSYCDIAMIFLGGGDDQEALAYSLRMAQHPNVRLTVIWLRVGKNNDKQWNMKNPSIDMMEHVKYSNRHKGQVTFKEEVVQDGEGTAQVLRMMEAHFGLVIVGRHHVADSPCTLGLTEWCELPELGPVGNLLATSDFSFSVLVVQQQHFYEIQYFR